MMSELTIGSTYTTTTIVTDNNTAKAMGSGTLMVFATPAMAALMEQAAYLAVQNQLPNDSTTVGTAITLTHNAPTPLGMKVTATAELIAIDRRKLTFKIVAFDNKEQIGEATHERFIIKQTTFLQKATEKSQDK